MNQQTIDKQNNYSYENIQTPVHSTVIALRNSFNSPRLWGQWYLLRHYKYNKQNGSGNIPRKFL